MKKLLIALTTVFTIIFSNLSVATDWPYRDITLITPYAPGGVTDRLARALQTEIEKRTTVSVKIKNMPGAANSVAVNYVLNTKNDNHTFIVTLDDLVTGQIFTNNNNQDKFVATNIIGEIPYLIFSNPKVNTDDFVRAAKTSITIGNSGLNGGAQINLNNLFIFLLFYTFT